MKDLSRNIPKNGSGDGGVMSSERGRGGYLPPTMPAPAQFPPRRSPWSGGGGVFGWKLPPQQSESMDLSTQPLRNGDTPINGQVKEVSVIATNPAKPSESAVVLESRSLDLRAVEQGSRTMPLKEPDLGLRGSEQGPRGVEQGPRGPPDKVGPRGGQEPGGFRGQDLAPRIQEASTLREQQDNRFRDQMIVPRAQEAVLRAPAVLGPRTPDTALRGHALSLRAQDISHRGQELGPRAHELGHRGPDLAIRAQDIVHRGQDVGPREETDLGGQELSHRAPDIGHRGLDLGPRIQDVEYRGQDVLRPRSQNLCFRGPEVALRGPEVALRGPEVALRAPPMSLRPQDTGLRVQDIASRPPELCLKGKSAIFKGPDSIIEAQDMCIGAQDGGTPKGNVTTVVTDGLKLQEVCPKSEEKPVEKIDRPEDTCQSSENNGIKVENVEECAKSENEDVPVAETSPVAEEIQTLKGDNTDLKDNIVSVESLGEKKTEESKPGNVDIVKTETTVEDPVESLLENMFEEPPVQHSVIVSPPLTQDKVVAILEEKSGGSADEHEQTPFRQVECELEKMFAGIVEEPKPVGGSGRKRRGGARGRGRAEKKKARKEVKEGKGTGGGSGGGGGGGGGSATATKSKGGPYVHIVGRRESPTAVVVVNNNVEEEGRRAAEGRTRGSGLYVSTLSARYNSNNVDPSWLCVFCNKRPHCPGGEAAGDLFGPYTVEVGEAESSGDKEISAEQRRRGWGKPKSLRASGPPYKPPSALQPKVNNSNGSTDGEVEVWVHEGCAVWAGGVMLVGGRLVGLGEAVGEAKASKCAECGLPGASLPCAAHACPLRTHYPCATLAPWTLHHHNFTASCPNHKDGTKVTG